MQNPAMTDENRTELAKGYEHREVEQRWYRLWLERGYFHGDEKDHTVVELTHNWDTKAYELGTGFGHLAIGVPDAYQACEELKKKGVKVVREAGPMAHGTTVIAFIEDPSGYKIELIQQKPA